MPFKDGTGPFWGGGPGAGFGRGRFCGCGCYPGITEKDYLARLKEWKKNAEAEIQALEKDV